MNDFSPKTFTVRVIFVAAAEPRPETRCLTSKPKVGLAQTCPNFLTPQNNSTFQINKNNNVIDTGSTRINKLAKRKD